MIETAKPKAKPKRKVETYTFDGVTVELRQVDPDRRECEASSHMYGPAQRSKWEVHIADVHLGFVFYPLGVANPWIGCLLEPQRLLDYDGKTGVRCWLGPTGEHGGWAETGGVWDGLLGLLKSLEAPGDLKQRSNSTYGFKDRAGAAEGFARAYKAGKLPDAAGVDRKIAAEKRHVADRKREDAERTARYAREREEEKAAQAAAAAKAEEERVETLMGLESIRDRLGKDVLSNLEMVALTRAIDRYSK
jgi:hypothetical protein